MSSFSQRSKDALKGVDPRLVRVLEADIKDAPDDYTINEGVRTAKTQAMYYTWGRSVLNPNTGVIKDKNGKVLLPLGRIVTKRDGVKLKSEHQVKADGLGKAVDFAPFKRDKNGKGFLDWDDDAAFKRIARRIQAKGKEMGYTIIWGGDWKSIYDAPHLEIKG